MRDVHGEQLNERQTTTIATVELASIVELLRSGSKPSVPYSHDYMKMTRAALAQATEACRGAADRLQSYIPDYIPF